MEKRKQVSEALVTEWRDYEAALAERYDVAALESEWWRADEAESTVAPLPGRWVSPAGGRRAKVSTMRAEGTAGV